MLSKQIINEKEELTRIGEIKRYIEYMRTEICPRQDVTYCTRKDKEECFKTCGLYRSKK